MKTACINARSLNETIFRAHADLLVLCGKPVDAIYQELKKIIPFFDDFIKKNDFSWIKSSSSFCVPFSDAGVVRYVYVMGLEQNDNHYKASEELRKAIGSLIRYAEKNKLFKIAFDISALNNAHERKLCIEEIIIASHVAHYHFDDFITDTARQTRGIIELLFCDDQENTLFDDAQEIGVAINTARHWSDLPPSILYPDTFAKEIKNYLQNIQNVSVEILDKSAIQALKMGGVLGVCQGSVHEPKVVVARYTPSQKSDKIIALVGKGVTFDTGGISIKPSENMGDMKADMAGAAAVMASMKAIAHFKPDVNVVACVPLVENMPSGSALKPGDIITFYNGKTAEVKNTDAEGRLILADALSYISEKYNPDLIIDAATLTGACRVALGPLFAALLSQDEDAVKGLVAAGNASGDRVWPLPLDDEYRKAIKSDVADIANIGGGGYRAGTITAAFFLKEFVPSSVSWVHLDIAGVATHVPNKSYFRDEGATGFGVKLFVEFIRNVKTYFPV